MLVLVLVPMGGTDAVAQEWLLGKRRSNTGISVKVKGKYRSENRLRVTADGGDFGGLLDVSRAALNGLADLSRAKGKPRFAVIKDRCWLPLAHGAYCTVEAVMLDAEQPAPTGTDPRKVFSAAELPAAP